MDFPREYIQFLKVMNGGVCRHDTPIVLGNGYEVLPDVLYGLVEPESLSLTFWNEEFKDDLKRGSMIIGSCPGNGKYLLEQDQNEYKVYYYDWSCSIRGSSEVENTYTCRLSLAELLALVVRPLSA